jgi:hypothetical protein
MTEHTSTAAELQAFGLTIDMDESTARKIKGELLIIEGRLHQGDYREPVSNRFAERFGHLSFPSWSKLYQAAYHAVAQHVVRADTAPEVLTEVIPSFLFNFSKARKWHPQACDLKFVRIYVRGPITEWQGRHLQMASESPVRMGMTQEHEDNTQDEIKRRQCLLDAYVQATGASHRSIYEGRSGVHKPEFYKWLKGSLPASSETAQNFERFLREKKPPISRNPKN